VISTLASGKPPVKIAAAEQRPPIIKKNLDRLPIRHPAENDQAFLNKAAEGRIIQENRGETRRREAERQHGDTDQQCDSTNPKQLFQLTQDDSCAIREVSVERGCQRLGILLAGLCRGQVNHNRNRCVPRQLACPPDNVFFGILV
jgi:hypothetical protein